MNLVLLGFVGSLAAGLVTAPGALPVLFGKDISRRTSDAMLGFAAGVMLAASFFSPIIPGMEIAQEIFGRRWAVPLLVAAGVLLGGGFVALLNEIIPETHRRDSQNPATLRLTIGIALMMLLDIAFSRNAIAFPCGAA